MANGDAEKCLGTITRRRVTTKGVEESAIDFVIFSKGLEHDFESMIVDEEKNHVLTRFNKTKKGKKKLIQSDHNVNLTKFNIAWRKTEMKERNEMYNLKNKKCQNDFTETSNNSTMLSDIFDTEKDLDKKLKEFLKKLNGRIGQSFNKARIVTKEDAQVEELFRQRKIMRSRVKENNEDEESANKLSEIEDKLADRCAEDNIKIIEEEIKGISCEQGGINSGKLWGLKKKLFPKASEPPTAMLDSEDNLLTNKKAINEEAVKVYKKRLENRKMKEGFEDLFEERETLAKLNMAKAAKNKTKSWTVEELEKVLKYLKKSKSRDPYFLANEIFHPEVAGKDLKLAILKMMNQIKKQQKYPKSLELCNISSIYKRKGSRNNFSNQRGIFRVTIFRSILDRLLYNDNYETIDNNLTDSNVGARKGRNIRDNLFVVGAILNDVVNGKAGPIDLNVYDVETCFDSLWLSECINDLHEAGMKNDNLPLLYLENLNAQIAIKTQDLISKRENIGNIVMQGSVWGSLKCTSTMEKLGMFKYKNDMCYKYKGIVDVPSLGMVDDICDISECGNKSVQSNAVLNTIVETKKLKLSGTKCHKIHIGKNHQTCPDLKVHENTMHESQKEKYLGDYIVSSGKLTPNIEARRNRAQGIISDILTILEDVPLGNRKLEIGLKLRQAMFINGVLYSSEAWSSISEAEYRMLERCDERLLRAIIGGHCKAAHEFAYMETAAWPLRWVVASRRLGYLHTLLARGEEELTKRVLRAQQGKPTRGDWWLSVSENMEKVGLENLTENQILSMSKKEFSNLVKVKIEKVIFSKLKLSQSCHSKTKDINYDQFKSQMYLKTSRISSYEAKILVRLRSRTVDNVKDNFRRKYKKTGNFDCMLGCQSRDNQEHILNCVILKSKFDHTQIHPEITHDDIYGNLDQQVLATQIFSKLIKIRDKIIKDMSSPVRISDWTSAQPGLAGAAGMSFITFLFGCK